MNKEATYSKKLEHPEWQKRRLEILTRDKLTCQLCSDTETKLDIHHKKYHRGKEPWEYPDEELTALCRHCHQCVTILQDMAQEPLVAVKLGDPSLPEFKIVLMVHRDIVGNIFVSTFTNPNSSTKMEYINSTTEKNVVQMYALVDAAKNLL